MRILHLFSDWKWTGPADPVLNMCRELERRGHAVTFACQRQAWQKPRSIATFADQRGVHATDRFQLDHHAALRTSPGDLRRLIQFLRLHQIEVIHTHLSHDHLLGGLAARLAARNSLVIRSDHYRDSFPTGVANRWLLTRLTDGVVTFSEKARLRLVREMGLAGERVTRINPALAPEAFAPVPDPTPLRRELGFGPDEVVIGVVARFQKYRKMDLFFEALVRAVRTEPKLRAMLIGRSSQLQETVVEPIRRFGLERHAQLTGYLTDRYREGLATMDAMVFLIAGSDGTARAMREAMALGRPVIANNTGMLPEISEDGKTGLIFNDNADELAACMIRLAQDEPLRRSLGRAAAEKARTEFSLEKQALALESFYEQCRRARNPAR